MTSLDRTLRLSFPYKKTFRFSFPGKKCRKSGVAFRISGEDCYRIFSERITRFDEESCFELMLILFGGENLRVILEESYAFSDKKNCSPPPIEGGEQKISEYSEYSEYAKNLGAAFARLVQKELLPFAEKYRRKLERGKLLRYGRCVTVFHESPPFLNVLSAMNLLNDRDVSGKKRVRRALRLLRPGEWFLPLKDSGKLRLLNQTLSELFRKGKYGGAGGGGESLDLRKDFPVIAAAFRAAYGIDLLDPDWGAGKSGKFGVFGKTVKYGKCSTWNIFLFLLEHLPPGTALDHYKRAGEFSLDFESGMERLFRAVAE